MVRETIERSARSGMCSFMTVLKVFGERRSPGLLSFPRPGVTLALDFPNRGTELFKLLDKLDDIVVAAGGAVYPAKDARMSGQHFRRFYPQWERLHKYVDPRFSSSLWRRLVE
jgi:FAD/FMN-containing dehydrogenase